MANQPDDWMTAASCTEGPPPSVRFADLPREHQGELVRFALVAAASTAYFLTLAILAQPLRSRSLAAHSALPSAGATRAAVLEARLMTAPTTDAPARARVARLRSDVEFASVEPPTETPAAAPEPPRRRNVFSRFFRSVLRGFQPAPAKADPF